MYSLNGKLTRALNKPMRHISDVRKCLNLCMTEADVEETIGMIPNKFGSWAVEFSDDGETFTVTNTFVENGEEFIEEAEYEFMYIEEV